MFAHIRGCQPNKLIYYMKGSFTVEGNVVDIEAEKVYKGKVIVKEGKIAEVIKGEEVKPDSKGPFIMPGFIDSHIHIEDTLMTPYEFSRQVVRSGTVASVSDPHEIANVLGVPGVEYMMAQSKKTPFKIFYGASPCVPATNFETNGATLGVKEIKYLLDKPEILYMAEYMNFPAVVARDPECMAKIQAAKDAGKPIDGHAPLLTGEALDKYISAGISTDHECMRLEEAREKIAKGMKVIVREGSSAHNLEVLYPVIDESPLRVMLCTDDCHPDDLVFKGHMDHVIRLGLKLGCKLFNLLRAATFNPVAHYRLPVGLLRIGDPADFIVVESMDRLKVLQTYINGDLVWDGEKTLIPPLKPEIVNNFVIDPIIEADVVVPATHSSVKVIGIIDRDIFTKKEVGKPKINEKNELISDPSQDILKICCLNRYGKSKPSVSFIRGFGIKTGACAFTIAHDSHDIICVGVSDADIVKAINMIIATKGGASIVGNGKELILPLPIAGLMSDLPSEVVAKKYDEIQNIAREFGSKLTSPFATLAFMALTVVPELKISDKGLFDGIAFKPTSIYDIDQK